MRNASSEGILRLVDEMANQDANQEQGEQSAADFAEHLRNRKGN